MTPPVDLSKVKWLNLCDLADRAAMRPDPFADDLPVAAGRLTTVKPLPFVPADESLLSSLRWDCTAYGLAGPATRRILAPGLQAKAQLVRLLLTPPDPSGTAVSLAVPEAPAPVAEPVWLGRADCGRD